MHINIECLVDAASEMGVSHSFVDPNKNVVRVETADGPKFFAHSVVPINDVGVGKIVQDKGFTYDLLHSAVRMPRSAQYLDPNTDEKYKQYLERETEGGIVEDIEEKFDYPVVIKRSRGYMGHNVFLCNGREEVETALSEIYNRDSWQYDYVAIAQEYVEPKTEYRAVVVGRKLELLYEKSTDGAEFTGNLSPLHWEGSTARHIVDGDLIAKVEKFIEPIYSKMDLMYGGIDIIVDDEGKFWLLEINGSPQIGIFVSHNGKEQAVLLYKKILEQLQSDG